MNTQQKIIRNKMGLLNLAEELGNVSRACKVMGYSRDTFYRYRELVEEGGVDALIEKTRRKANPKNRIPEDIEEKVVAFAVEQPAFGQVRASNELRKKGSSCRPPAFVAFGCVMICRPSSGGWWRSRSRWLTRASCSPRRRSQP